MGLKNSSKVFVALKNLIKSIERTSVRLDLTEAKAAIEDHTEKTTIMYLPKIAWDYELGNDIAGTTLYPSVEDCKREHCEHHCGVVKVNVSFIEVIEKEEI